MQVVILDIAGLCGRCGSEDFDGPPGDRHKAVERLTCRRCGTRISYGDLVVQIAQEAVNQSKHNLRILRGLHERHRTQYKRLK